MSLAVFDIGGTAVKHGLWTNGRLTKVDSFATPQNYEALLNKFRQTIQQYDQPIEGAAISSPGAVDVAKRQILGISAVEYIHHRPIFDELESCLNLPVAIENDANCAGIAEVELGAGRDAQNMVFVVLGTGVGGAIFIQRQLYKGSNLFGGEFGLMKSMDTQTFSKNGTLVKAANFYTKQTAKAVEGKDLFWLSEAGDQLAANYLDDMYQRIANNLYNIQVTLDPELIILGGGVSKRPELAEEIASRLKHLLKEEQVEEIMPQVRCCAFQNDANLVGAALNFERTFAKNEK
ncbi:ROK family protein [Enterococcus sp. AZ072]|uniref:ROK family protein n=1 Tax=unclassified Enterococcus TaxID=2608891 RepID=UPI003D2A0423